MATLKSNIHKISDDTETLAKDYLKLFSVKQSEKLALFLGILTSVFILATLLLILIVFSSFALAGTLNRLMNSELWGFVIMGGIYILVIVFLIVKIFRTRTPLFANLFVKLIVGVMNIDSDQAKSVKGLKRESEHIKEKIETDKTKIEADFQILKYTIIGSVINEAVGLFTSKSKKRAKQVKEEAPEEDSQGTKE